MRGAQCRYSPELQDRVEGRSAEASRYVDVESVAPLG
jgi:hypothetical protein